MLCWTCWGLRGAMGQSIGRRGGRRRWWKFVDVGNASTTPTRVCRTRRGIGSPQPRFGVCRARGRSGKRLLSAAAAARLTISRSRCTGSRSWAPTGRRRRWRCFVIEIGGFFAGIIVHLDWSRFYTRQCHQLDTLARDVDTEACRSTRVDAIGAGVGCRESWKNASAENEDVGAACQVSRDKNCWISMG